ncbi:hypothetical protein E7Z54_18240 [Nocardioides sp.]|nr:hypothetical protein E7Z54_18240 [Nocardioides sp.]
MINDIAAQFGHLPAEKAAGEVANHVRKFWDPRMQSRLLDLAAAGPGDLAPVAYAAAELVRREARSEHPTAATSGGFVSVRTTDGWLEVDAAVRARPGLERALGIGGIAATEQPAADLARVRAAIERVSAHWTSAEVLLALEQDGVRAHRSNADPETAATRTDVS